MKQLLAPATATVSAKALGDLPEWDLDDLFPGRDSAELATATEKARKQAQALDAKSPAVHIALGNLYRESGQFALAEREFNHALSVRSTAVDAYIGLALTFDIIMDRLVNPAFIDYILSLLVGTLLLWAAWGVRGDKQQQKPASNMEQLTPIKAFGIGAIINIVGLPFALPYFAALDQILKADLTVADSALVIIGYNIGYALPFLVVPLLAIAMGERSRPVLARVNEKVDRVSAILMPFILAIVGIALVADAISYLATGEGLF